MKSLAPCIWQNVLRRPILVLITALVSYGSAQAQESLQYREYEFSGFAGGSFIPESHFSTPVFRSNQETARTVEMEYNTGFMFGARVTQNAGENWAGDLEYTLAIQRLNINNLSPTIQNLSFNTFIHHLSYNV